MARLASVLAKWTLLTVVAVLVGSALGGVYAVAFKDGDGASLDRGMYVGKDVWPPTAPVPITPEHDTLVDSATPEFTWHPSEDMGTGQIMYVIQFAYDKDFSGGEAREYANIFEPRFKVPAGEGFAPGIKTYWRVYAVDGGLNQGPDSQIFAFTVVGAPVS